MTLSDTLFAVGIGLILLWLVFLFRSMLEAGALTDLRSEHSLDPPNWPPLSIVIAARNEADTLEKSLSSLVEIDYPNIEIVAVDDRSNDGTGNIIDNTSAHSTKVLPVHITSLPAGWLGKVNALSVGALRATGEWLLFSDADIHFSPDVLRRAVAYCEERSIDHLALIPESRTPKGAHLLEAFNIAFGAFFLQVSRVRKINSDSTSAYTGVGAFNLVRKTVFDRCGAFEALRMEILDDVGLGLLMKKAGAKSRILNGAGLIHFTWYPTLRKMIGGLEKNSFAGFARYNYLRAISIVLLIWGVVAGPFLISLALPNFILLAAWLFFYFALPAIGAIAVSKKFKADPLDLLVLPVGYLLLGFALLRSAFVTFRTKGIGWRDTFYPLDELRKGQIVKLL